MCNRARMLLSIPPVPKATGLLDPLLLECLVSAALEYSRESEFAFSIRRSCRVAMFSIKVGR